MNRIFIHTIALLLILGCSSTTSVTVKEKQEWLDIFSNLFIEEGFYLVVDYKELNSQRILNGNYSIYYPSGEKYLETKCVDGLFSGKMTSWHKNGKKETEVTYINGARDGWLNTWNENGILIHNCYFENQEKNGYETYWLQANVIDKRILWEMGTPKRIEFFREGVIDKTFNEIETKHYFKSEAEKHFKQFNEGQN